MFLLRILVLVYFQTLVQCMNSTALYCTSKLYNEYEVNRLQSIFTIGDKVYIRVGTNASKLWVYDIQTEMVLNDPIMASDLFPGFPIVEFVATVLCDECPPEVSNLVIIIGRKDLRSYHKFGTFRLQSDGSFVKLNGEQLPRDWILRNGEEEFSLDALFYGFFPESMVTLESNSSYINGFVYFPWLNTFNLKYFTEVGRYFLYRKLSPDGTLSEWKETGIEGNAHVLNSAFFIKENIYSIDNDPQYMPKISHQIFAEERDGQLVFRVTDIDLDAREFFNCYEKVTPSVPPVPPVTLPPTTPTTSPTTEPTTRPTTPSTPTPTTTSTTTPTTTSTTEPTTTPSEETTTTTSSPTETTASISESPSTQTPIETTETSTNGSKPEGEIVDDKEGDDYVLFLILLFILLFVILLIVFSFICILVYIRRRNKGDELSTIDGGTGSTTGGKKGIVLGDSPSSMSMRSGHDNNPQDKKLDSQSPSSISMRSYHEPTKPMGGAMNVNGSADSNASPSTASVRSFKN